VLRYFASRGVIAELRGNASNTCTAYANIEIDYAK
jgi:hypothetical protein